MLLSHRLDYVKNNLIGGFDLFRNFRKNYIKNNKIKEIPQGLLPLFYILHFKFEVILLLVRPL